MHPPALSHYHASGQLLLTSEYLVLTGVPGLAVPLPHRQQSLIVTPSDTAQCTRTARDRADRIRYHSKRSRNKIRKIRKNRHIASVLHYIRRHHPHLTTQGRHFTTHCNWVFQRGLGTSATLLSLLGQRIDESPSRLAAKLTNGSGYDVATSLHSTPVIYTRTSNRTQPRVRKAPPFVPDITKHRYIARTGHKTSSERSIKKHRGRIDAVNDHDKNRMAKITQILSRSTDIDDRRILLREHNKKIRRILGIQDRQIHHARTRPGIIKPLGARGGDMLLVIPDADATDQDITTLASILHEQGGSLRRRDDRYRGDIDKHIISHF